MGASMFLSIQFLINPLSLPWVSLDEPVEVPLQQVNPFQTIEQIKAELSESQLVLGDKLVSSISGYNIYPILDQDSKAIRQIRVYEPLGRAFWEAEKNKKLRLVKQTEVLELEEAFIKAPFQKYKVKPTAINPERTLPLTELKLIEGDAPSQGIWFMAIGRVDGGVYGRVFSYLNSQLLLEMELEWTNSNDQLPQWQRFPTVKNPEPDLVIDQTQNYDPLFLIFRLEATNNPAYPFEFRHLNLHESPAMPKLYNDALVLASGGLWSPALAKLEALKSQLQVKEEPWEPVIQEQYDLISYHAKITSEQARENTSDYGLNSLMLGMDGAWAEALSNLQGSDFGAKIVLEMLATDSPHLWGRVNTALEVESSPEVVIWGSVIVLQRQDLPSAERWLRSHWKFPNRDISEAISLLQRVDLSPLGIEPQQFVGTVRFVGDIIENKWQITPPPLISGQNWYEIDISVIRDQDVWRNAPFPELQARSRLIIWKALGLDTNNSLTVEIPNTDGETTSLIAKSISIDSNGQIQLLATGSPELGNRLGGRYALVKGGNFFIQPTGSFSAFSILDQPVVNRISEKVYQELSVFGKVSVSEEEFREKLLRWSLEVVNLQGKDSKDLLLKIDREKIDLGDRSYPIVIIFSQSGDLLFSDMSNSEAKRWVTLLPGSDPQKILIETNGTYESQSLAP
jgi:hypothetical protein